MIGISLHGGDLSKAMLQLAAVKPNLLDHIAKIFPKFPNFISGANIDHLIKVSSSSSNGCFNQFRNGSGDPSRIKNRPECPEENGKETQEQEIETGLQNQTGHSLQGQADSSGSPFLLRFFDINGDRDIQKQPLLFSGERQ